MNCCCAIVIGISLAVGQTPVNENLKIMEPLIGNWEGTFPVPQGEIGTPADLGLEVGKTVPAIGRYSWGENGQSIDLYFGLVVNGVETPITRGIMTWCPKSKSIIGFDTYASGTTVRYTVTRNGDRFHWDIEGVDADADEMSYKLDATVGPKKFVTQATDHVVAGERLPDEEEIVFYRVDKQSTREEFREYCKLMVGRWVGDITLAADLPGVGKKGDAITAYGENWLEADGQVLLGKMYAGQGTVSWQMIYDARARQIREANVTSGGATWIATIWKQEGVWHSRSTGSNPDGKRTSGDFTVEVSDNGRTHTWSGTMTTEGEEAAKLHEVYHRVSK